MFAIQTHRLFSLARHRMFLERSHFKSFFKMDGGRANDTLIMLDEPDNSWSPSNHRYTTRRERVENDVRGGSLHGR